MTSIAEDSNHFYSLLSRLDLLPNQGMPLRHLAAKKCLPVRGVYFFREPGEVFQPIGAPRIVRVGTHAISSGSKATLHSRLKAHLGTRSGSGNHRGSIFRLHLGLALLNKEKRAIPTWGKGSVVPEEVRSNPAAREEEALLEKKVSDLIGEMSVLWVDVPDEPSSTSERAFIERNAIALLSNHRDPLAPASQEWLGLFSDREEIRASLLWNLNHVDESYDRAFLLVLEQAVERTCSSSTTG
jgi:hypothetical protein